MTVVQFNPATGSAICLQRVRSGAGKLLLSTAAFFAVGFLGLIAPGAPLAPGLARADDPQPVQQTAQADAPETRAREQIEGTQGRPGAAAPAARSILDETDAPASFADVLKAPDDVQLNLRFARQQIRDKNLLGASSTLERILNTRPDAHRVRLLYALVLYRLKSNDTALRELNRLRGAPLSTEDKAEVDATIAAIEDQQQQTRVNVALSLGVQFDSNRGSSPESRFLEAAGRAATEPNGKNGDRSFLAIGSVGVVHDLGYQEGHRLFANLGAYNQMNAESQQLDLAVFTADVGGVYRLPFLDIIPRLMVGYANIDQTSFNQTYGAELSLRNDKIADDFGAGLMLRGTYENYNKNRLKTGINERNDLRDGMLWEIKADFTWRPLPVLQLGLSQGFSYKTPNNGIYVESGLNKRFHERRREYATGFNANYLVWRGIIAGYGLIYTIADYTDPDPLVNAGRERFDWSLRHSLSLSVPFTAVPGLDSVLPPLARNLRLIGVVEHFDQDSSIQNYNYQNTKGQILFSNRVTF